MPKKKQYTKAQKAAYAKKMAAKKKAPKTTVKKQNQFRVEYKDRVSPLGNYTLTSVEGSTVAGPSNSLVLVPHAMTALFNQGPLNGQVEGNNINPRYLNMKVKLNFDLLPAPLTSDGTGPQQYEIFIYHGFITNTLRENLTSYKHNDESGRTVPAFGSAIQVPSHWTDIAKRFLFNARLQPDFLSYEKKLDTQVRILSKKRVLGDLNSQFQNTIYPTGNDPSTRVTPDKHYSFNWKMPKDKQLLSPALDSGEIAGYGLSSMFVPFVMITMDTKVELGKADKLNISDISHFTYTDS